MFTPQEIQEQTFSKAVFGGYDMQQVDDFLEPLTEDYIMLYKENSVLKSKMKVLVEKLEEYRGQEAAMKQQMAQAQAQCDRMIAEAQSRSATIVAGAETTLRSQSDDLKKELAEEQARRLHPAFVAVTDEASAKALRIALADTDIAVGGGEYALCEAAVISDTDAVVTAVSGAVGLRPTLAAIEKGRRIALANKETLVVAGELINQLAQQYRTPILPVDSEHSAVFQCLAGEVGNPIEKVILTASGGPFRTCTLEQLKTVTKAQALKHPNWEMGAKITIDSASMMNKGFEVIEAKWLFGVQPSQIEVVVHPQSVIHSMVQFEDGAVKAQLGMPDMRLPIQYAFSYPDRICSSFDRLDFTKCTNLTFEQPDTKRFRNLALAYEAMYRGGNMPCIVNAANEVVVASFLKDGISFLGMSDVIEKTMERVAFVAAPAYDDYVATDAEARRIAAELIS